MSLHRLSPYYNFYINDYNELYESMRLLDLINSNIGDIVKFSSNHKHSYKKKLKHK